MKNFEFYNPTKVYFGKDEVNKVGKLVKEYGNNVLLVYGKGSIKKTGLYERVIKLLEKEEITVFELGGIDPNPRIEAIRLGGELCKKHQIDLVLAVGGGSVIDAAKGIAAAAKYEKDPWDFYAHKAEAKDALAIATVLTLSATGSEMNPFSVVTNFETQEKNGWGSNYAYPKFSILDPTLTYSVSYHQTGCGIVDILTHVYEFYFSKKESYLNNRLCEAIMKTVIHYGPIALKEPSNYEARANLMFSSTLALNGIISFSNVWEGFNHTTEHVLSAVYDIAHGDGLSILGPTWMKHILSEDNVEKFYEFAVNVWGIEDDEDHAYVASQGISAVFSFYRSIKMPLRLKDVGIINPDFDLLAEKAVTNKTIGEFVKLTKEDVKDILMFSA